MASIRPLEREDLPAVVALIRANLGSRRDAAVLERTLVDHPWAPVQLPALVAVNDSGEVIGSIGAQARRLRFDGEERLGMSVSHLVVAPDERAGAAGALLVRSLLAGDQDLTWTDSGTEDVVRIWRAFGAHVDHVRAGNWMLILRPGAWFARTARGALRRGGGHERVLPVRALPLNISRGVVSRSRAEPSGDITGATATPAGILELLDAPGKGTRLRVDYDEEYLSWLFAHVSSLGAPLVPRLVRRQAKPIGWYAYLKQRGAARLIHLAAIDREVEPVFDEFVVHAQGEGASMLAGRVEPNLDEPLRRRFAAVGLAQRPLVHSRDPELRAVLATNAALITEMDLIDSEWW